MKKLFAIFFTLTFFSLNAQKTNHDYNIRDFNVQFIRTGIEGTILFKVISIGKNTDQAITNAKSDAIKAILFQGIPFSDLTKPLLVNENSVEKNRLFFEAFFKNEKYLEFVSIANDGSISGEDRLKFNGKYKIGVIVSVNKKLLREYLENNNIINKLSDRF
jgi:hypothetical protein